MTQLDIRPLPASQQASRPSVSVTFEEPGFVDESVVRRIIGIQSGGVSAVSPQVSSRPRVRPARRLMAFAR